MAPPKGGEIAARIRAAHAYSGLKQPDLAAALGVSVETLSRMSNGRGNHVDPRLLEKIAEVCEVPQAFMDRGWEIVAAPDTGRLDDLERQVIELRAGLAQAAAESLRRTRELQEQLDRDRRRPHSGDAP